MRLVLVGFAERVGMSFTKLQIVNTKSLLTEGEGFSQVWFPATHNISYSHAPGINAE